MMTPVVSCSWDVHTIIVTNCTCMINNGQLNTICFIVLTPSLILQFVCVDERAKKLFKRTYILIKITKKIFLYVYIGKIWRGLFLVIYIMSLITLTIFPVMMYEGCLKFAYT